MADLSFDIPADDLRADPFLRGILIKNYKSIGKCALRLGRMSVLIGRNGSGKSNFLDAIRFVVDGLETSLDHAVKSRGGITSVRRKSTGHPRNFSLQYEINLSSGRWGRYGFEVVAREGGGFSVKWEDLEIRTAGGHVESKYRVEDGDVVQTTVTTMPRASRDRLHLVVASGLVEFREPYDALRSMGFYNLNPEAMKELQSPDAGEILGRDGGNVASVLARLQGESPAEKERIERYLGKIVAGIEGVDRHQLGPRETLEFRQRVTGAKDPWRFFAANMSDGTLRALGVLLSASQLIHLRERVRLVGIEEPEAALHPSAARGLMEALEEATDHTQVMVTTHSPDLLDAMQSDPRSLLVVESVEGETFIGPADPASMNAIREHLYTAGDLQRANQLEPDRADIARQQEVGLFDEIGAAAP